MHKVVIAPDSFKGVLSAREVCDIISYKINRHYPFCQIVKVPVALRKYALWLCMKR